MPDHFKRYSGCRGLVRRMPLLEQTRFGCHEFKKVNFFLEQNSLNRLFFKKNIVSSNFQNILVNSVRIHPIFNFFSALPTSITSFQILSECTINRLFLQPFLCSSNFRNIISKNARMNHFTSLFFIFFSAAQTASTSFQITSEGKSYRTWFQNVLSCSKKLFKYCPNAAFSVNVFTLFSLVKEKNREYISYVSKCGFT